MNVISPKKFGIIEDFKNRYIDTRIPIRWNVMKFSNTSYEHQKMLFDVCWWLYKNNIPFATEVEFKTGYNPDLIVPTHIKPIIEVRYSEKEKDSIEKFSIIPEELQNQIIYIDAKQPFDEKMLL